MTPVNTARRAANSDLLRGLTRFGFVGYGLLHLAVAWLALQIAFGKGSQEGDQSGAFQTIAAQPFGKVILWAIIVGLVGMALWQLSLAIWGHLDKRGKERIFERVASAVRMVIYGALAFTAGKVVTGAPTSNAQSQQQTTAGIMAKPAGAWLVGLAGAVVLVVGIGMIWYGWKRKFQPKLALSGVSMHNRKPAIRTGQIGYIAKGIAFAIVGYLVMAAAVKNDPSQSRGLDAALHTIVAQPYGKFLLVAVAAGLAAFGIYCFYQAKYRKVGT